MPYLRVLAKSYQRFLLLKTSDGSDTAVDAALDMMAIALDYVRSVPTRLLLEHGNEIEDETSATIMTWQNLVAGTTCTNPVTKAPAYSHGFLARFTVWKIYEHDQRRAMGVSEAWGVSGFAPRYVGPATNGNQIEHMSISLVLQTILDTPAVGLAALEEAKVLSGSAPQAEAAADMALKQAIHDVFLPAVQTDLLAATEALRKRLKQP
jgi:hypothetical protein